MASLGAATVLSAPFWLAVTGLVSAGVLNLGVSFSLALALAIRARGVEAPQRSSLRAAVFARLWARPLSFLRPD